MHMKKNAMTKQTIDIGYYLSEFNKICVILIFFLLQFKILGENPVAL